MKKENFLSLIMASIGVILFGVGMCMCLVPQWDAFHPGVIMGSIGLLVLILLLPVRRRMQGKPPISLNGKALGVAALAVAGALFLGTGMCMTMVWTGLLVPGILVGILGVVMLLGLIPVCLGLK